ncbi:hypothetical protein BCR34DRAFT_233805 [Clohesyomyces aquaticus]|uniref:Uncharacterized protein n=1 Tax=Clohesyomyces aquaticus TaxID=1231657 RepID=A0A1Y1ZW58_9PLEO|nr:hypothetical protein BCR34DRAFT_233805 [Clohesyomyces aquaticus]
MSLGTCQIRLDKRPFSNAILRHVPLAPRPSYRNFQHQYFVPGRSLKSPREAPVAFTGHRFMAGDPVSRVVLKPSHQRESVHFSSRYGTLQELARRAKTLAETGAVETDLPCSPPRRPSSLRSTSPDSGNSERCATSCSRCKNNPRAEQIPFVLL